MIRNKMNISYKDALLNRDGKRIKKTFYSLSGDIIKYISDYLPYLYFLSLKGTNKDSCEHLKCRKRSFKDDVIKKLRVHNPRVFVDSLKKYDHYLSGSFVLNVLTGDPWKWGDLDVFKFPELSSKGKWMINDIYGYNDFIYDILEFDREKDFEFIKYDPDGHLANIGFGHNDYDKIKWMRAEKMNQCDSEPYPFLPMETKRFEFYGYDRPYTHSLIENMDYNTIMRGIRNDEDYNFKDIFDFIDYTVDFEFLKIIFDGENLYIKNIDCIYDRECDYDFKYPNLYRKGESKNIMETYKRKDLVQRILERKEKYEKRGYKINLYNQSLNSTFPKSS